MSIPQNAIPVTIDGKKYVVEIDEFGGQSEVGAGRIISIEDETEPKVVSNLRLEVHQPENFAEQAGDPGANIPLQSYAGHYCNVPQREDPGIVACSCILSGLRVFDIRDPKHPKEIAYFNAPVKDRDRPARGVELGDVEPRLRRRERRDLVLGRLPGLLHREGHQRRLAFPEVQRPRGDDRLDQEGPHRHRRSATSSSAAGASTRSTAVAATTSICGRARPTSSRAARATMSSAAGAGTTA